MNDQKLLELCNEFLNYNPTTGAMCWKKRPAHSCVKLNIPLTSQDHEGYLRLQLKRKTLKQHRLAYLIVFGFMPSQIDHINGIRNDNRIKNLRPCTTMQNAHNQGIPKNNTSGYKRVCWVGSRQKWSANIVLNQENIHLGYFICKHEAARSYNRAALKYYGEFAWLNKIEVGENV